MKPGFLNTKEKSSPPQPVTSGGGGANPPTQPESLTKPGRFLNMKKKFSAQGANPPPPQPEFVMVEQPKHESTVSFVHYLCKTRCERLVSREAFERRVVVVRCHGCQLLLSPADHSPLREHMFIDGLPSRIDKFMRGIGADMPIPSHASSFCATFETKGKAESLGRGEKTWLDWAKHLTRYDGEIPRNDFMLQLRRERDHIVIYTHPCCSTKMFRIVWHEAYERGLVVARCTGCNQLFALADRLGSVLLLEYRQSTLEKFVASVGEELKQGSEDIICWTPSFKDLPDSYIAIKVC